MGYSFFPGSGRPVFFILCVLFPVLSNAAESTVLPEPLTLESALLFANKSDQYQLQSAEEQLQQAIAEAGQSRSENDISVNLSGRLRQVGASDHDGDSDDNDSVVSLFVRKPIYDFGKTAGHDALADMTVVLRQLEKTYLIEQRELSISQKYFDVLNADNEYLRHNEDLAIGFIRFDRARENQELGLASEIEVLEHQAAYEVIRQNRYNSENLQRLTRVLLAEELGFPDQPSSEVAVPELHSKKDITDDVDALVEQAFKYSLVMKIQHQKLNIALQAIEVARHTTGPILDAELEVSDYARQSTTRDDWRATLYFDIPLYSGSREKSAIQAATAKYQQALSDVQKNRSQIRIEVLKLWQAIRQNSLRLGGEIINQEYRDMVLDRSRAEYELEFSTDLGDSMVQFSDSRMQAYRARFALEMAWRELEKLVGKVFLDQMNSAGNG